MAEILKDLFGRLIIRNGDLLKAPQHLILHQANNHGVMGAGIGKLIAEDIGPEGLAKYRNAVKTYPNGGLGMIVPTRSISNPDRVYLNAIMQNGYGRDGSQYTDYDAMKMVFDKLAARFPGNDIAMPYGMGAGLGGGDWSIIKDLIDTNLAPYMNVTAYELNDDQVQQLFESPESNGFVLPFKGSTSFLSNMYPSPVTVGKFTYDNAEGAFQAGKLKLPGIDPDLRARLLPQFMHANPYDARRLGRYGLKLTPEQLGIWNQGADRIADPNAGKYGRAFQIVQSKFSDPTLLRMLEETGDRYLQEDTDILPWGGTENALGRMLMVTRALNKK